MTHFGSFCAFGFHVHFFDRRQSNINITFTLLRVSKYLSGMSHLMSPTYRVFFLRISLA